ncbi:sugar phosphate isomerase/epimerase family protein [Pseudonocardia acaciae]|uniref:sugar phosphate isomerase/epimerase family protein n=1 Tax=Pseudonocardia acaciae TaxID=551276 RepID=UPI0004908C81|nr:sugar phosphate isomerase/epimerase family protein [Pseudonocardia acaciae]
MTLSINRASIRQWSVAELVDGCARRGVGGVGLWREDVAELGTAKAAALVHDAGLEVTSLCRGGFFTAVDPAERRRRHDDNRRAVDETAAVGTDVLVLVSGGLPDGSTDLAGARAHVADAVAELAPYARERGVRLAIEPLHPMFCSDRCVVSTLDQALDIAEAHPADAVGVIVDAYHVWWDPGLDAAIRRAGDRIAAYQVSDWVTPLPEGVLTGRGLMGEGCIPLDELGRAVASAGYSGPIEVEIFSDELWSLPGDEALNLIVEHHRASITTPTTGSRRT